jgi:hypothetical protein
MHGPKQCRQGEETMSTSLRHRVLSFNRLGMLSMALAAVTAALAAALLEAAAPAGAAFPGPNGRIAFASDRDGDIDIYSMNPDGTGVRVLTNNSAIDTQPAVSPDGRTTRSRATAMATSRSTRWMPTTAVTCAA